MANNVDTFFPTYLPTGRLATHNKHDKQRFKHKTFIHQSKNHDCNKKTQFSIISMKRKSQNYLLKRN